MGYPTTPDGRPIQSVAIADSSGVFTSQKISAGPPATGQSAKTVTGSGSINTGLTVTWETVTTGKTLYITDITISTDSATPIDVQLKAGATVIFESFVASTAPINMAGLETQPTAASGTIVTLVFPTLASKNAAYFLAGYEQ